MIRDIEAAYAAGILDGEGSISLTRVRKNRYPSPQVSVSTTDPELLDWFRARFGGSIVRKPSYKPTHSQSYEWKVTDREALRVLERMRPYMVIERKKRRCDLLLAEYLACTPRNGRYTQEQLERKQLLIERFSSLP
jgi:hypothetical protein